MNKLNYKSILIAFVFLCIGSFSSKAESSLNALSDIKGVEYIYISESMLNSMGGKAPVEMLSAISGLTSVEILVTESETSMSRIKNCIPEIVKGLKLESKVKDEDESVSFYGVKSGKFYSELLMIMEEDDEIVIIKLKGKIDTAAIKELID